MLSPAHFTKQRGRISPPAGCIPQHGLYCYPLPVFIFYFNFNFDFDFHFILTTRHSFDLVFRTSRKRFHLSTDTGALQPLRATLKDRKASYFEHRERLITTRANEAQRLEPTSSSCNTCRYSCGTKTSDDLQPFIPPVIYSRPQTIANLRILVSSSTTLEASSDT